MENARTYLYLVINVAALFAIVVAFLPGGTMNQLAVIGFALVASVIVPALVIRGELKMLRLQLADARHELTETQAELAQVRRQVQEAATLDDLTGAYNRRHFENLIAHHGGIATRGNYTFSICATRIDNFEALVEKIGRDASDEVLRLFVRIVKSALREVDSVARVSGETFGIMFSGAAEPDAINAINRIIELITQIHVSEDDPEYRLSVSSGLTEFTNGVTAEEMMADAEHALGFAVEQGGDRVAAHTHSPVDQETE